MDQFVIAAILSGLAIGILMLGSRIWRAAKERGNARAAYLDACKPLFDNARTSTAATGFARLSGRYEGQVFDIQVLPDTLTFRKLPALWVLVTLPQPLPLRATFDLMIRPTGVEPFSHFQTLPAQVDLPEGFPEDSAIRTDAPDALPDQDLLLRHMGVFDDPRMKEMVLSPKGARLVFLAEEADRGRYLIYRDCEMGRRPLPADRLKTHLDALLALRQDVLDSNAPETDTPDEIRSATA